MEKNLSKKRLFYIFYFAVFLGGGIQGSFLNLYLNQAGMDKSTVGFLNGMIQILCLAVFPLWGIAADRAKYKNSVLIIQLAATIAALFAFAIFKSVWMIAVIMVVFSLVHNPMPSIYETITMANVKENGWVYSPIRMSGTIGYSLMALIAGFWLSKREGLLFPIYIGVTLIAFIFALMLPKTRGTGAYAPEKKKSDLGSILILLKNKKIRNVLILSSIYTLTNTFNGTYYAMYMTELGGAYFLIGVGHMIMGLSEIPFHVGPGSRWLKKLGIEKSMVIVMLVGTVRWLVAAVCKSPIILVITMAFNGIMLVPTIVGLIEFLYDEAPDDLKTTAQTALKSPFQLAGQLIGNFAGAALVGRIGIRSVYLLCAPICLLAGLYVGIPLLIGDLKAKKSR